MSATDTPANVPTPDTATRRGPWGEVLHSLLRSGTFLTGLGIVLFWIGCALFGEHFVPYDPLADDIINALSPPSAGHWFGTDQIGRDVFSRVIVGSRDILTVAPLATLLATVAGTALGLIIGYFRGIVDDIVSRVLEAFMAIPFRSPLTKRRSEAGSVCRCAATSFAAVPSRSVFAKAAERPLRE